MLFEVQSSTSECMILMVLHELIKRNNQLHSERLRSMIPLGIRSLIIKLVHGRRKECSSYCHCTHRVAGRSFTTLGVETFVEKEDRNQDP